MTKKRKQRVILVPEQKARVVADVTAGKITAEEAANEFGIALSTVHRLVKMFKTSTPKSVDGDRVHDATVYLKQANRRLMAAIRNGQLKEPDGVHLLMLLALRTLEGAA